MHLQLVMPLTWFQFSPIASVFKSKKTRIDVLLILTKLTTWISIVIRGIATVPTGFEPVILPWQGSVITTSLWDQTRGVSPLKEKCRMAKCVKKFYIDQNEMKKSM